MRNNNAFLKIVDHFWKKHCRDGPIWTSRLANNIYFFYLKAFSEAGNCRTLEFRPEKAFEGRRLINHVIRVVDVTMEEFCETMCFLEPDCVSINLDRRADVYGKYKCELNNVTHEGHEHEWRENQNQFYHAAEVRVIYFKDFAYIMVSHNWHTQKVYLKGNRFRNSCLKQILHCSKFYHQFDI